MNISKNEIRLNEQKQLEIQELSIITDKMTTTHTLNKKPINFHDFNKLSHRFNKSKIPVYNKTYANDVMSSEQYHKKSRETTNFDKTNIPKSFKSFIPVRIINSLDALKLHEKMFEQKSKTAEEIQKTILKSKHYSSIPVIKNHLKIPVTYNSWKVQPVNRGDTYILSTNTCPLIRPISPTHNQIILNENSNSLIRGSQDLNNYLQNVNIDQNDLEPKITEKQLGEYNQQNIQTISCKTRNATDVTTDGTDEIEYNENNFTAEINSSPSERYDLIDADDNEISSVNRQKWLDSNSYVANHSVNNMENFEAIHPKTISVENTNNNNTEKREKNFVKKRWRLTWKILYTISISSLLGHILFYSDDSFIGFPMYFPYGWKYSCNL